MSTDVLQNDVELSIFVPCFNEQNNITNTLMAIREAAEKHELSYEVLVVDDGSTDSTKDMVKAFQDNHPKEPVHLFVLDRNMGIGRNYVDAAFWGKGHYYMLVNGDNAEPMETLSLLFSKLGEADIVIPYFADLDSRRWYRRLTSKSFTRLINTISGLNVMYYNGPCIHRRYNVMRWSPDTNGYGYQAELICRAIEEGATFTQIQINNTDRASGSSSAFSMKNIFSVGHSVTQIMLRRLRLFLFY